MHACWPSAIDSPIQAIIVLVLLAFAVGTVLAYPAIALLDFIRYRRRQP
jgi:hypothetical protein